MGSFGQQNLGTFGSMGSISASSMPENVRGGNIDWSTVTAASSSLTLLDDIQIEAGEKFLRYGAVLVQITEGSSKGMFGPFDCNATDGRQSLERSRAFVLDRTVRESEPDSNVQLFDGGTVWKARLLVGDEEDANQPSWDDFNAAFPRLRFIAD